MIVYLDHLISFAFLSISLSFESLIGFISSSLTPCFCNLGFNALIYEGKFDDMRQMNGSGIRKAVKASLIYLLSDSLST